MMRATPSGRRAGAVLFAAGVQAVIALLLLFSLGVVRQTLTSVETLLLLPTPKPEPIVIDARQPPKPRDVEAPLGAMPAPPAAPVPAYALPNQSLSGMPSRDTALIQGLARSPGTCRRQEGEDRLTCPGSVVPPDPRVVTLDDDEKVKNEELWAEEKRRASSHDLGIAVGPGIGFVIQDPLCKLAWVMLAGGFRCGPPPPVPRRYTDAQFTAAQEAYYRRRGGGPQTALPVGK
jgi:hypothetical protein